MEELIKIQQELKAPKSQFNSFGKFNYRSLEDILEALKPLLKKHECYLVFNDQIVNVGVRYYVRAAVTIFNASGKEVTVTAYAREPKERKGMDASQITGSTSSYARKYALNGLFAIDDTRDADGLDNTKVVSKPKKKTKSTVLSKDIEDKWATEKQLKYIESLGGKVKIAMTMGEASKLIKKLTHEND